MYPASPYFPTMYYTITTFPYQVATVQPKTIVIIKICSIQEYNLHSPASSNLCGKGFVKGTMSFFLCAGACFDCSSVCGVVYFGMISAYMRWECCGPRVYSCQGIQLHNGLTLLCVTLSLYTATSSRDG